MELARSGSVCAKVYSGEARASCGREVVWATARQAAVTNPSRTSPPGGLAERQAAS